jgi:hypothetical protein
VLIIGFVLIAVVVASATILIVQNAGQVPDSPAGRADSPGATRLETGTIDSRMCRAMNRQDVCGGDDGPGSCRCRRQRPQDLRRWS